MAKDTKTLVLLDAHAIIHRAYHALPEFLSSKGEPTGALYGLSSMLMRIITDLKPDYIVACYDLPQKTFRHEAYEGYKAGRVKTDEALVMQLKNSRQIFEAFDIPVYDSPGFEADDILGTIVKKFRNNKDINIIIASGDMDTMQLIDGERVKVYTLKKGINDTILYDEDKVNHRGKTKMELLSDPENAWQIFLIEDLPNIPLVGKGKIIGHRKQIETNKTPAEYLEMLRVNKNYQGEKGLTPEADLTYAIIHLEETNQIINDWQGKGSISYELGALLISSNSVSRLSWNRDFNRADLWKFNIENKDPYIGTRVGIKI